MQVSRPETHGIARPARIANRKGRGPVILLCDHASNYIPSEFGLLGLEASDLDRHIAWDPGALPVAERMMTRLDAPLVASGISRLVIDCNRDPHAPDAIPETGEGVPVPGNRGIGEDERLRRAALAHEPYHRAIDELTAERSVGGAEPVFVAVHTFTPVYFGKPRPWHVGIIHDADERLAGPLAARLAERRDLTVGVNEPYSPEDRVYYTLARHATSKGFMAAMIEIRNDLVTTSDLCRHWGDLLSSVIAGILAEQTTEAPSRATRRMLIN